MGRGLPGSVPSFGRRVVWCPVVGAVWRLGVRTPIFYSQLSEGSGIEWLEQQMAETQDS